jgi:hypothetical protein
MHNAIVKKIREWKEEYFGPSAGRITKIGDMGEEERKMWDAVGKMEDWTPESIIKDITFWGEMGWLNLENLKSLYNDYAEENFPSSIADKVNDLDITPDVLLKKNSNK